MHKGRRSPRAGAAHHLLGRHDHVDVHVVRGGGDDTTARPPAAGAPWSPRRWPAATRPAAAATASSRSLNPPPLPSRAPVATDRHAPGHHQVDGLEVVEATRARRARRALDAAAVRGGSASAAGSSRKNGLVLGQARHRHVDEPCRPRGPARRTGSCGESGLLFSRWRRRPTRGWPPAGRRPPRPPRSSGCGSPGLGKRRTPGDPDRLPHLGAHRGLGRESTRSPPASWSWRGGRRGTPGRLRASGGAVSPARGTAPRGRPTGRHAPDG